MSREGAVMLGSVAELNALRDTGRSKDVVIFPKSQKLGTLGKKKAYATRPNWAAVNEAGESLGFAKFNLRHAVACRPIGGYKDLDDVVRILDAYHHGAKRIVFKPSDLKVEKESADVEGEEAAKQDAAGPEAAPDSAGEPRAPRTSRRASRSPDRKRSTPSN